MSAKAGSFRSSGFEEVNQKQEKPLYCVSWCKDIFTSQDRKKSFYYFAACGGVNLSIFETEIGVGSKNYRLKHSYYDEDENEEYHSCAFGGRSSNEKANDTDKSCEGNYLLLEENKSKDLQPPLLCVGGKAAIIKVIDLVRNSPIALLRGHGHDITDLKVSPTNEYLLLSAAKDESCRLWNLETFACVCIFAGQNGHRKEEVLSVSWHPLGQEFASSGVDKSIRLWSIADPFVSEALQASRRVPGSKTADKTSFRPYCSQFPYFATTKVHLNVVECVQWLGDMILSKSTYNSIVLWMPDLSDESKVKSAAFTAPSDIIPLRYEARYL